MLGVNHPRPTAMIKACGVARFSADYKIKDALELAVVHSTVPHAKIKSIDTSAAEKMPGVAGVVTAKDIKGTNRLTYLVPDRPVLCEDKVHYIGDAIAVVGADTREQALAAAEKVVVELEPLPVISTPEQAMAPDAIQVNKEFPNLIFEQPVITGDAQAALAGSATVVEAEFQTQIVHQAALEPEVTVAYWEEDEDEEEDMLVVVGAQHQHSRPPRHPAGLAGPREHALRRGLRGRASSASRPTWATEGVTAAAAIHFKRPVRYVPNLQESMLESSKRHPFKIKVKVGADADGKITGYCQ